MPEMADVERALGLLNSETADALIGERTPAYNVLIRGVKAVMGLLWAVLRAHGLAEDEGALKAHAQALLMLSTLVHYAYALGIERGRREG